jgi:hypothetical protein
MSEQGEECQECLQQLEKKLVKPARKRKAKARALVEA